jgi:hypothetical protein
MTRFASPRPIRACLVVMASLAALPVGIEAAPLDLAAVPADAQWLMHMDMDAARGSTVMQRAWEKAVKMHPHLEKMMVMGAGMAGMDPRKDLRDVTVYGTDLDKRNGVMIVRARANRAFLEKMVEKAPDHKTVEHGKYVLHGWTHKGWKGHHSGPVMGAFFKDDVMVFARSEAAVKQALDVLDGTARGVGEGSPLAGRVRPGSIMVARASAVDPNTKCPVLKSGKAFRVALGEHEGQSFYRAKLDMKSAAAAGEAEDVVQGLASLASLRWGDDEAVMALVKGVDNKVEGDTCTISWDAPADRVWTVVEKAADSWEKRQDGRWRRHGHGGDGACCGACDGKGCKACEEGGAKCPMKGQDRDDRGERPLGADEF